MQKPIRFGIQATGSNTTWSSMLETWKLIESLGYDTLWNYDHFFPILSDPAGPCLEAWTSLAALAASVPRIEIGTLVTGNTYRNPAVLAKMAATVDNVSGGRLIMGVGAAWFELEHAAYNIPFYTTAERIRRFDEAMVVIKRLWSEPKVSFEGRYYKLVDAYCEPKPVRKPMPPLMIGGAGEKLMLRAVARHADQWNTFGSPQVFKHKIAVLRDHCAAIGRNFDEIEISWAGATRIAPTEQEKDRAVSRLAEAFHARPEDVEPGLLMGSVQEIRDRISRLIDVGVTHFILFASAPFDHKTIRTFAEEVIPAFRA
jgi:F420-dependent oxidoreductase-like protein